MTSSDIRLGAWKYLQWEHIRPIRMNNQITTNHFILEIVLQIGGLHQHFNST
jgi:hypothetical protein